MDLVVLLGKPFFFGAGEMNTRFSRGDGCPLWENGTFVSFSLFLWGGGVPLDFGCPF